MLDPAELNPLFYFLDELDRIAGYQVRCRNKNGPWEKICPFRIENIKEKLSVAVSLHQRLKLRMRTSASVLIDPKLVFSICHGSLV